jgi:hypothetical protein
MLEETKLFHLKLLVEACICVHLFGFPDNHHVAHLLRERKKRFLYMPMSYHKKKKKMLFLDTREKNANGQFAD